MSRQESTSVVRVPLAAVESKLSNVEDWPQFLVGLTGVEKISFGRYHFRVDQGGHQYEVPVAVSVDHHDHRLSWHAQEGPKWDGEVKLSVVDEHHTKVHLVTVAEPRGSGAGWADLASVTSKDDATVDIQRLEALVCA